MDDDEANPSGTKFLRKRTSVAPETIVHLVFNPPYPPKPDMTDYLWLQGGKSVFSKKIYDVLKNIPINDFQLVPAVVKDRKDNEYSDYWIAGVYGQYAFLDEVKSEHTLDSEGDWSLIKSMTIDQNLMSQVPLEERLIYVGKESSAYVYYHKSIVDAIMSVNPTGIRFVSVEDWEG